MTEPVPELDPATAVSIGRVLAPRGVRGELKVEPLTDFPERFAKGAHIWLRGQPRRVAASRWQGRHVYLTLEGVEDREAAAALRDELLQVPEAMSIGEEDVFYQHDIVGLRVETASGEALGRIESIFATGANDVYVVRGERGELLLPAVEDVIRQVDLAGGRLVIDLLPGLEFTKPRVAVANRHPARPRRRVAKKSSGDGGRAPASPDTGG